MAKDVQIPDERFSCQSCGRCCRMWTITVDESKVQQLRKVQWPGQGDPFIRRRGEGDPYRLRMVQGRCFFLDEENRCRIHTTAGYAAKPEGCKAFPLLVGRVAGTTHLRLSFYCPSVTAGTGKRLQEQTRWIQSTTRAAGDVTRQSPLTLDGQLEISVRDLELLEAGLGRLLGLPSSPVVDRLAAGAQLLTRVVDGVRQGGKGELRRVLRQCEAEPVEHLARQGREAGIPSRAGPVLSLFLGHDCAPGALPRMGHFFGVRLFNVGLGRLRSQLMGAKASLRAIRRLPFAPEPPGQALLTRYLLHKLVSRRILSGEHSMLSGFNLLVAAYGVISLLARLRAVDAGRSAVTDEDVTLAVQAADLLVLEHTALYQGGMLAELTEAVLAQELLASSILKRVEPITD